MGELTRPQEAQLRALLGFPRFHIGTKAAVKSLVRKGLAETNGYGCTKITEAGKAALQAQGEKTPDD